jgi:hypothetical protein
MGKVRSAKSSSNRRTETAGGQQDRSDLAADWASLHCELNWDAQVLKSKLSPILSRVIKLQEATSHPALASREIDTSCAGKLWRTRVAVSVADYNPDPSATSLPRGSREIQGSYQVIQSRLRHFVSTRHSRSSEIPVFWEIASGRLIYSSEYLETVCCSRLHGLRAPVAGLLNPEWVQWLLVLHLLKLPDVGDKTSKSPNV